VGPIITRINIAHQCGDFPAFADLYITTGMSFRCPNCDSSRYDAVTVKRPNGTVYRSESLFTCGGCSAVFTDPARFSRPPPSGSQESMELRGWESHRTLAKRARANR
jgi:hypothetical protein